MKYTRSEADISPCGKYRWALMREWERRGTPPNPMPMSSGPDATVCFVMLNPSTADGTVDDPTIRRCVAFADAWGFTRLVVRNLYPLRATDPGELAPPLADLVGAYTTVVAEREVRTGDYALIQADKSALTVAGWGSIQNLRATLHADHRDRVKLFLLMHRGPVYCLGKTKDGDPRHPLYIKGGTPLTPLGPTS